MKTMTKHPVLTFRTLTGGTLTLLVVALGWLTPAAYAADPPPNIILILADDFGYECVGADGGTSYRTPALDQLAGTGMRFNHCYVQPVCTPTRVQLMTGIYNVRNYITFGEMDPRSKTFANGLKAAGYATCMAGKWQLGRDPALPKAFGFDEACLWQHLRLARAFFGDPHLVVLDEPNASLDYLGERVLFEAIERMKAANTTVIIITHRIGILAATNKIAIMQGGAVSAFGDSKDIFETYLARPQVSSREPAQSHSNQERDSSVGVSPQSILP